MSFREVGIHACAAVHIHVHSFHVLSFLPPIVPFSPFPLFSLPLSLSHLRNLANGSMKLPSRTQPWTSMKGITFNLTTNQKYVRNFVFKKALEKVMKQTNGVYPAPLKILEVCVRV